MTQIGSTAILLPKFQLFYVVKKREMLRMVFEKNAKKMFYSRKSCIFAHESKTKSGMGKFSLMAMRSGEIHTCPELMDFIQEVGFLPLLDSGIRGYSAENVVDEDNRYVVFDDGGWDWPLWKWKGPIVTEGRCVYGKFFAGKAGFVSKDWWPDLCNYRRASRIAPLEGSIEEAILMTLAEQGSLITRELRAACGFDGPKMRSKFDGYVTRLQMACRIVTEDFVYPIDKHGREYGWGWSLLTTPESLLGREMCRCDRTPQESFERMFEHLRRLLPEATEKQIVKLIK